MKCDNRTDFPKSGHIYNKVICTIVYSCAVLEYRNRSNREANISYFSLPLWNKKTAKSVDTQNR